MHELRVLEQTALEGYSQYNFAKGSWRVYRSVYVLTHGL